MRVIEAYNPDYWKELETQVFRLKTYGFGDEEVIKLAKTYQDLFEKQKTLDMKFIKSSNLETHFGEIYRSLTKETNENEKENGNAFVALTITALKRCINDSLSRIDFCERYSKLLNKIKEEKISYFTPQQEKQLLQILNYLVVVANASIDDFTLQTGEDFSSINIFISRVTEVIEWLSQKKENKDLISKINAQIKSEIYFYDVQDLYNLIQDIHKEFRQNRSSRVTSLDDYKKINQVVDDVLYFINISAHEYFQRLKSLNNNEYFKEIHSEE